MSLRLTVLGGAAAWPNPGQGCSSYLVASDEASVLVDCGPDTLLELRKHADYRALDAILISHCHADHILDLVPYRYGLVYGPEKPQGPIPLWLPPGGIAILDALASALGGAQEPGESFWADAFDVREYDPTTPLSIADLIVSFARTRHTPTCYAMRIAASGERALCYTADTGATDMLLELARDVELVLAEATTPQGSGHDPETQIHLTPRQAGEFAASAGAGTLVLTHLWSERPDDEVRSGAAAVFDGTITIAKPGMRVDVR